MTSQVYLRAFPLYDSLYTKVAIRISTGWIAPTRERIADVLSQLDTNLGQQVSLLLIHYWFLINPQINPWTPDLITLEGRKSRKQALPYGMKISSGGKGVSVDINSIPDPLLLVLAEFCGL